MLQNSIVWLAGLLLPVLHVALVLFVVLRKRDTASAISWSLFVGFVPVVGFLFFLLFGMNRIPRRLRRKLAQRQRFDSAFVFPPSAEDGAEIQGDYPPNRWGRIGRTLEAMGEAPRRHGNAVSIFHSGEEVFASKLEAIAAARHHVHIEYFIFRCDALGLRLLELLERKIAEGVEVRMIVDSIGTLVGPQIVKRVQRAGGYATTYQPFLRRRPMASPNLRMHRKILICDGKIAFFGGLNVGLEYLGRACDGKRPWYDLHVHMQGPAVRDLQRIFVEDWDYSAGEVINDRSYFPTLPAVGPATVQIIAGGPDTTPNPIRQAFFLAITRAQTRIRIATPYLVPDRTLVDALTTAARSGVDVDIITQWQPPDRYFVFACGLFYIEELLGAGVHVYGTPEGMMHAKACALDSTWAMVGTANLDNRSLFLNFEQMAVFDGQEQVAEVEAELDRLLARSVPFTLENLRARPLWQRLLTQVARLMSPLL